MCLVIDTNCLGMVFDAGNANHLKFQPITKWITKGKGKVIYGGSKYKKELRMARKYFNLLVELRKQGRVIVLNDEKVDEVQKQVQKIETDPNFNDAHIIAIVIASRCRVVCTGDKKSYPFLKKKSLYPKNFPRPGIYQGLGQRTLIANKNIQGVCLGTD